MPKVALDNEELTPEQLVEKWNAFDPNHKWAVVEGEVAKIYWPGKDAHLDGGLRQEDPNR